MNILKIETNKNNFTRFVVLGKKPIENNTYKLAEKIFSDYDENKQKNKFNEKTN